MSEQHDAAAAYALDALDPAEAEEFEEHLAGCDDCRREVAALRETAADLVLAEPAPPPPPALRAAVLAGITGVAQLPPVEPLVSAPAETPTHPEPTRVGDGGSPGADPVVRPVVDPVVAPAVDPVVDELALRRESRRARVLSVLVAAVTVVALALGFTVWGLVRQQEPPVAGPAPTVTVPQVDPSLLAAPDARIYSTTVNGAAASFVVSKSRNRAAFVSSDLPSAGAGNVFHLWTLRGTTVVRPDNVFSGTGQVAQAFSGPVDDSTALAINIEPAGTAPQAPTNTPLAVQPI